MNFFREILREVCEGFSIGIPGEIAKVIPGGMLGKTLEESLWESSEEFLMEAVKNF